MGSLTPGAHYTYENVGGIIYGTEVGKNDPQVHGYMYDSFANTMTLDYELETVWKDILIESRTNSTLHDALERVKILYHLSKDNGKK